MEHRDHLKFMLVMGASDGGLSDEERRLLFDRAQSWGISKEEFAGIVDEVTGEEVDLAIPETKEARMAMLTDVVRMMGADGKLHEQEKQLFAVMAEQMELSEDDVNRIIDTAIGK